MLRRPMMYISSLFAAAVAVSYYFGVWPALLTAVFGASVFFVKKTTDVKKMTTLILMMSYLSGVICFAVDNSKTSCVYEGDGNVIELSCKVSQLEQKQYVGYDGKLHEYLQLKGRVVPTGNRTTESREKILIKYYSDIKVMPGDVIEVKGTADKADGRRNPGCFDYRLYLKSIGITTILTAEDIRISSNDNRETIANRIWSQIQRKLYIHKEDFLYGLEKDAGRETSGLMRAVLFGEKTELDEDTLESFRENGTAHVLAVSGLHVGIIYGFLSMIWRWKKGGLFFGTMVILFLAYMVMASFSPSVVRAVIMIWLHIFAKITNRKYDMASAAFFTAFLIMLYEPMHLFNTGFQMSFLAVLTLSLLLPMIRRVYSGIFLGSMAIQLGLTPYTIYVFNYISLSSIFINVPVIYLTGILVPAGMCCMAAQLICEPLSGVIAAAVSGLAKIMITLNDMTGIKGMTVFDVRSPDLWVIVLYYLVLLVFVSEDGRLLFLRKKKKTIMSLIIFVVAVSLIFGMAAGNDFKNMDIVFIDVGQGDCIHFRVGKTGNYLIDGGGSAAYEVGKKTVKPYLLKNGAKNVDGAFVTHLHTDHYKGITELCREGMVEKLYVYEGYMTREAEIIADTGLDREDIIYLYAGQKVILGNDVSLEVIWPEKRNKREYELLSADETDENSMSLIMKLTVKNKSILATGDVDAKCLDSLTERFGVALDIDILKAAHHGSKYSDSEPFAAAAEPEYAVFQVGKNNFGHPDKGIIEKFRRKGIMIYRNDTDGAIAFDFGKKGKVKVRTVKGE